MTINDIVECSEISIIDLEKILEHLPEPNSMEVNLFGEFDYSDISRQTNEVVQGAELIDGTNIQCHLKNPSKKLLLDIYKASYEMRNKKTDEEPHKVNFNNPSDSDREKILEHMKNKARQKRIDLEKASWYLPSNVRVELTRYKVSISYSGKQPDYISKIRKHLEQNNIDSEIKIN
jgi:hypothetical protein